MNESGIHRKHRYAGSNERVGDRLGEAKQPGLAGAVPRSVRKRRGGAASDQIDDPAASPLQHARQDGAAAIEWPLQIGLDVSPPFVGINLPYWPDCPKSGRVV